MTFSCSLRDLGDFFAQPMLQRPFLLQIHILARLSKARAGETGNVAPRRHQEGTNGDTRDAPRKHHGGPKRCTKEVQRRHQRGTSDVRRKHECITKQADTLAMLAQVQCISIR